MSFDNAEASQLQVTEWMQRVSGLLKENSRRFIPDSELGYAVLYCSISRFCNPSVDAPILTQTSITPQSGQSLSQSVRGQTLLPGQTLPTQTNPAAAPTTASIPSLSIQTIPAISSATTTMSISKPEAGNLKIKL